MPTTITKPAAKKSAAIPKGDAIALLKKDHRDVKALFKEYGKLVKTEAAKSARKKLAETICEMLTVHATIEEEIFYPAARDAINDENLLDEAEVEHASAKELIGQIQAMQPDEELYDAKVTVLGEYIDHHVQEEEGEMFLKVKKSEMDTAAVGEQLAQRKEELLREKLGG